MKFHHNYQMSKRKNFLAFLILFVCIMVNKKVHSLNAFELALLGINSKGISYEPVAFEKADEVVAAYDSGRCDTYTTDKSGLAAQRTKMSNPDEHIVLPETISKEPLGPVVRQGDSVWEDIVRWSLNAMIEAEEYGITSANADSMKTSENPAIKRLVGAEGELGAAFGLDNEWSLRIIKQVGNYGESYKRNIADTGILPDRGPNQLWTKGGILYVPPAR